MATGMVLSGIFHIMLFLFPAFFFRGTNSELHLFKRGLSPLELTIISRSDSFPQETDNNIADNLFMLNNEHEENGALANKNRNDNLDHLEKGIENLSAESVNVYPRYPLGSRIRNEEGDVKLMVSVDKDGVVRDVEVLVSSGYRTLDKAARDAFLGVRFPVVSYNQLRYLKFVVCFRLHDK